jgi:hypothetical protein
MAASVSATPHSSVEEEMVAGFLRDFSVAETKRGPFEGLWEQVARKVLPNYASSFTSGGIATPGARRDQEQFDVTANSALWKFSAAMESMLTPANGKWQKLRPIDPILKRHRDAMEWYDVATERLFYYRYSSHAGFQANMHENYTSVGAFGTGALFTDQFMDPTQPRVGGLRYRHIHLGEVYFGVNHQGQVDTVYRRFPMTLRQIAQKFGAAKLPDGLRTKLDNSPEDEQRI